ILTKEAERRLLSGGVDDTAPSVDEPTATNGGAIEGLQEGASGGAPGGSEQGSAVDIEPSLGKIVLPKLQIAPEVTKQ
ncbi:MAG TPA: hypothetical protein VIN35_13000, partial [Hydrogenophaga sp.]